MVLRLQPWTSSLIGTISLFFPVAICGASIVTPATTQMVSELDARGNQLYREYLDGDANVARKSLLTLLRLFEEASLKPLGKAHGFCITYARLYILEKRTGNFSLSEAYLVKARYWRLRLSEIDGDSEEDAAKDIASFDGARCIEIYDKFDRDHNGGKEPNYAKDVKMK